MADRHVLDGDAAPRCCDTSAIASRFDEKVRAGGDDAPLHATTRGLVRLLGDPTGRTVLELGCGRGGLLASVLERGAASVGGVDLSAASVDATRRRLAEGGFAERSTIEVGNGATAALSAHDWVVLDRVICCYPDAEALLRHSAAAASGRYAFSVPASRGWRGPVNRVLWAIDNFADRFKRCACRGFVHDLDALERLLGELGFSKRRQAYRGLWYLAVFERKALPPQA